MALADFNADRHRRFVDPGRRSKLGVMPTMRFASATNFQCAGRKSTAKNPLTRSVAVQPRHDCASDRTYRGSRGVGASPRRAAEAIAETRRLQAASAKSVIADF
jgi:hypothetical protein